MKKLYSLALLAASLLTCGSAWADTQTIATSSISKYVTPTAPEGWTLTLTATSNKNQSSLPTNLATQITNLIGSGKCYSTSLSSGGMITVSVPAGNKIESVTIGLSNNSTGTAKKQIGHGAFSANGTTFADFQAISAIGYDNGSEVTLTPATVTEATTFTFGRGAIGNTKPSANTEARIFYIVVNYSATAAETGRVTTINSVTVNGTALKAGQLANLISNKALTLTGNYTEAPAVVFNTQTVVSYADGTSKTSPEAIEATVAAEGTGFVATATVGVDNYTINFAFAPYSVSWSNIEKKWDKVCAYVWNADGSMNNGWPGTEMTLSDEADVYELAFDPDFEPAFIIFNNGGNGEQTGNLDFVNGKKYGYQQYTVSYDNTLTGWTNVHAYIWNGYDKNAEWPGAALEGNTYSFYASWEPANVIFNNGEGGDASQTADLVFENGKTYTDASFMDTNYYVKVKAAQLDWNFVETQPVRGIATFTFGPMEGEFEILVYPGKDSDIRYAEQTLVLGEWATLVKGSTGSNLTFPAECATAIKTIVTFNVNNGTILVETADITPVKETTIWDWSNASTGTSDIKPAEASEILFGDFEGWAEGFNADALAGFAQYAFYGSNKCFQGSDLRFKAAHNGIVTVEFSNTNTAAKNGVRALYLNGEDTGFATASGSTNSKVVATFEVNAGEVALSGMQILDKKGDAVEEPTSAYLRIYFMSYCIPAMDMTIFFNNADYEWENPIVKYSLDGGKGYVAKAMTKDAPAAKAARVEMNVAAKKDIWNASIPSNATHVTFTDGENSSTMVYSGENVREYALYDGSTNVTGVENVTADATDAAPVYYNLQGMRVEQPTTGVYIVVRGSNVTKEILR